MEQTTIKSEELWFNTPDSPTLCRGGSNGPQHPSQLYAIEKYIIPSIFVPEGFNSFLDYGAGSGTTYEALKVAHPKIFKWMDYIGVDIIPKNTDWCKQTFPDANWEHNPSLHKIDQPDKSFDVVYSRHVVDHMESFEKAMDEHKRVAKKLVILILWVGFSNQDEHEIKNIIDHRGTDHEKLYPNEYTNTYSKKKVVEYLHSDPEWELLELNEDVGNNQVIVLRRKDAS